MIKIKSAFLFLLLAVFILNSCTNKSEIDEPVAGDSEIEQPTFNDSDTDAKPVIYLYPEEKMEVDVQLDYDGELTYTYPNYDRGWNVTAHPDGKILNRADGKEYSYLFWEGESQKEWQMDTGFVVKGEETVSFLREKLEYMGLTPKEYNEFIVYWAPHMENNPYNLIHFAGKEYEELAKLTIKPKPDSILRVFMVYKALDHPIEIEAQNLSQFIRKGFTVIEWGGRELGE